MWGGVCVCKIVRLSERGCHKIMHCIEVWGVAAFHAYICTPPLKTHNVHQSAEHALSTLQTLDKSLPQYIQVKVHRPWLVRKKLPNTIYNVTQLVQHDLIHL